MSRLADLQAAIAALTRDLQWYFVQRQARTVADLSSGARTATVGESYNWTLNFRDNITRAVPVPDLSTYTSAEFDVRQAPSSAAILSATTTNGQLVFGAAGSGQVTVSFQPSQITAAGAFTWEIKFIDSAGAVSKPVGGQFVIQPTFTS